MGISFLVLIYQQFFNYALVIVCYYTLIINIYNFWRGYVLQCTPRIGNLENLPSFFVLIQKNLKIKTVWKTTTKAGYARKQKLVAASRHRRTCRQLQTVFFLFAHKIAFCLTCFFRRSVFEAWRKLCKHGMIVLNLEHSIFLSFFKDNQLFMHPFIIACDCAIINSVCKFW